MPTLAGEPIAILYLLRAIMGTQRLLSRYWTMAQIYIAAERVRLFRRRLMVVIWRRARCCWTGELIRTVQAAFLRSLR